MHAVIRLNTLLLHLAAPAVAGAASAFLAGNTSGVYQSLVLPRFAPPGAVFSIVWTGLYILMGVSAYLIYTARDISRSDRNSAMTLYVLALVTGYLWNFLFFRFRLFSFSALWIVVVFLVSALCTALFYRIRPTAGVLMAPTLAWLVFAGVLNFSIARLN